MSRCVWSRNLKNEEAVARVGPQRHKKKKKQNICDRRIVHLVWLLFYFIALVFYFCQVLNFWLKYEP